MEHVIVSHIMKHLEFNNILSDKHFGFRSRHSCETQLLITIDNLARALNNKLQIDCGILDFAKAFDKVPHLRLLHKLEFYGIRGCLLNWIKSFLTNRTQQVVVEGSVSSSCEVTSGVPQGSVLGPALFLIYINDITENINSQIRLFADDCLIYRPINSIEDHLILQNDLHTLVDWSNKWQMEFNIPKCTILQITLRQQSDPFDYRMNNIILKTTDQHPYLGICLHHKLSWNPHITQLCNKANRLLGFLHRNLKTSLKHIKEMAYKQFILPVLQYCSTIWDPHQHNLIHKLEMVQHRAARFVLNRPWKRNNRDSITELLQQLNWSTLETQRKNARPTLLFSHQQYTNHPYRILTYKILFFHHQSSTYNEIYALSNICR